MKQKYICKCGETFEKDTTADTTGYRLGRSLSFRRRTDLRNKIGSCRKARAENKKCASKEAHLKPSLYYLLFAKQSLQYTGRSSRGLKGTLQVFPQDAQVASNISRSPPFEFPLEFLRASRQDLHLWGSFVKPLDA